MVFAATHHGDTPRRHTTATHHGDTPRRHTTATHHGDYWQQLFPAGLIFLLLQITPLPAQPSDSNRAELETVVQRVSTTIKQGGREAHSQDWLRIETLRDADGNTFMRTNVAFVELATGMHYRENGQWLETRELIEGFSDGAIARHGPHKVIFAPNLNTAGAIELETPAGQRLRSHVLGLAYVDVASGKSVFIGEIKDCAGEILGANQVIYSDAFHGVKADVRYTYRKSGFEQDIILREQPPTPESLGMDRRTTRLQVYTEFLSPPMPTKAIKPIRETMLTDEALDFGGIQMIRGRAFSIADEDKPFAGVSTGKQWLRVEERDLLVEEVEFPAIEREMADLPAPKRSASLRRNSKHWASLSEPHAFAKKELPKSPQLRQRHPATMQLASARPPQPGFVLDYVIVLTSITDYTFKGDTTYLIADETYAFGTTTIEGGTVIKYSDNPASSIRADSFDFQTAPYRPAIFTSKHDNTVGEILPGSSGSPQTGGHIYLYSVAGVNLRYGHVRFAGYGIYDDANSDVWHSQFVSCGVGIVSLKPRVFNALFANCGTAIEDAGGWSGDKRTFEHVTADACTTFVNNSSASEEYDLNNCIFTAVGTLFQNTPANAAYAPFLVSWPSSAGIYQPRGAGNYYLADSSAYRDVGTTDIDSTLFTDLARKTTHAPPTWAVNNFQGQPAITPGTIWSQTIARDSDNAPDLGYHYDPLDHCVARATLGGSLTLNPGTALAYFGSFGFHYGTLSLQGSPLNRVQLAHYSAVQEQPIAWVENAAAASLLRSGAMPALQWRFADVFPGSGASLAGGAASNFDVRHCELYAARMICDGAYSALQGFTNNILQRCTFEYGMCSGSGYSVKLGNNLVLNSRLTAGHFCYPGFAYSVTAHNNLFVGSLFTWGGWGAPQLSHNGYHNSTVTSQGSNPKSIATLDFQSGPLGPFYYPTTVNGQNLATLINAGSTTADALNLCPFTTATALNSRESTTQVDIGFHYVGLDASGQPQDHNFNGSHDYAETPMADPQTVSPSICRDTARTITLNGSGNSCTPLIFQVVAGPAHGTLNTMTPANTSDTAADVIYTPTSLYCGPDSFTFKVKNNGMDSALATVTLTVGNDVSATSFSVSTCKSTPANFTLSGSDSCAATPTFQIASGPAHGVISGTSPNLTYTPNPGFCGMDSLQYRVDGNCTDSELATVTFTVGDPNPVPDCADVMTAKNTAITFTLTGSDSCNDTLTYVKDFDPLDGTITQFNPTTGQVTYQPNPGFEGTDFFLFHVNNCGFSSGSQIVTINVVPGPTLTTDCRPDSIRLSWTLPPFLQLLASSGYIEEFKIFRCSTTSGNCTPSATPFATISDPQITSDPLKWRFADTSVTPGQTYCYEVTFHHRNSCDSVTLIDSPKSNLSCNQLCVVPPLGPMDVAFIIDNTGSMGAGPLTQLRNNIAELLDNIETSSGNDYRLALLTTETEQVNVRLAFSSNNRASFAAALNNIVGASGIGTPESTDECLNTVVNALTAIGRTDPRACRVPPPALQINDFTAFRTGPTLRKLVVLITDHEPGGFCDVGDSGSQASVYANQARANCIRINAVQVGNFDDATQIMVNYMEITCGWHDQVPLDGTEIDEAVRRMLFFPPFCSCP